VNDKADQLQLILRPVRFGVHGYSAFPPKTVGNRISGDSTLVASLVKIGGRLQPVERSVVCVTDSLTNKLIL